MMADATVDLNPFKCLDEYETRHVIAHLIDCGRTDEVHELLSTETSDGRNAWYLQRSQSGSDVNFQHDVERAAELAWTEPAGDAFIQRTRYQIISSSLSALNDQLPPRFVTELVASGAWSARKVLDAVSLVGDVSRRAKMLSAVLPFVSNDYQSKLIELVDSLSGTARELVREPFDYPEVIITSPKAELLAKLSTRTRGAEADRLAEAAITETLQIRDLSDRARCLGRILADLPENYHRDVAERILAIADECKNPERVYLTLPVFEHCKALSEIIRPRISMIASTSESYYRKQSLEYFRRAVQLNVCSEETVVSREAIRVAVESTEKGTIGLFDAIVDAAPNKNLIKEAVSKNPKRMSKRLEREWVSLLAFVDADDANAIGRRLTSLRHTDSRIDYYLRIRPSLDFKTDQSLINKMAEEVPAVRSLDERVRLASELLATGRMSRKRARRLANDCVLWAVGIRNAAPRFVALRNIIHSYADFSNAIEPAVGTISSLTKKTDRAAAWLDLAECIDRTPRLKEYEPWQKSLQVLRNLSRQQSRLKILERLIAIKPESCFVELKTDLNSLDPEHRAHVLVRSMKFFDQRQRTDAAAWLVNIVKAAHKAETRRSILARSAEWFDTDSLVELISYFRSIADNSNQYECLGKLVASAPKHLVTALLSRLASKPGRLHAIEAAISPFASTLKGKSALKALDLAGRGMQPSAQAEIFFRVSTSLKESDHELAITRALAVKKRVLRLRTTANVVKGLHPDVFRKFEASIDNLIPAPSRHYVDHSSEDLIAAICQKESELGRFDKMKYYISRATAQTEQVLAASRFIASNDNCFFEFLNLSREIFDLDSKANIQLSLLAWRARLVSVTDSICLVQSLDRHCMPIVVGGLAPWLSLDHVQTLLNSVNAVEQEAVAGPAAKHDWGEEDPKIGATVTMMSGGYFAPVPTGPVEAADLTPKLLAKLVDLDLEDRAWRYLHYATSEDLTHFITMASPNISNSGLERMVEFAHSLSDQSDFIASLGALAIEFVRRRNLDKARSILSELPVRSSNTPHFFRHRRVGQLLRSQFRLQTSEETILPNELVEQMASEKLANYPRIAIGVACLVNASETEVGQLIDEVLLEIERAASSNLEAAAISCLVSRVHTLPSSVIYKIAEWALGGGSQSWARRQRPRGAVLDIIGELAPAIKRVEGEEGIRALYRTVEQVCSWWE